jgi:hypothetical protein
MALVPKYAHEIGAYAEIGIGQGDTALKVINGMSPGSIVHLFDFDDVLEAALAKLRPAAERRAVRIEAFGNTHHDRDSYCWSLMKRLQLHPRELMYDYVYLDGAHMWDIDGFAFCLLDRLLKAGGRIEFDDWGWTAAQSPSMGNHPKWIAWYTTEQMQVPHVNLVIDLLVRTRADYVELVANRVYRKVGRQSAP